MNDDTSASDNDNHAIKTIMILEPEVSARLVLSEYLRHCGYKVIEGTSAEDAYAVLHGGQIVHIILADVQLTGDVDGFRLSHGLKQTHPEIEVILTYGPNAAADKAAEFCDRGPLKKPYSPQEVVDRILSMRASRQQSSA